MTELRFIHVDGPRSEYRMLNIMVERLQLEDDNFGNAVIKALREYADACEKEFNKPGFSKEPCNIPTVDNCFDCHKFTASNETVIKVIAGGNTITK